MIHIIIIMVLKATHFCYSYKLDCHKYYHLCVYAATIMNYTVVTPTVTYRSSQEVIESWIVTYMFAWHALY